MKRTIAIIMISSFFVIPTFAVSKDPVVATVNGVTIKKSDFDREYQQNMSFVSNQTVTKEKVLHNMINRIVGIQKAKANKLDQDPIVKYKIEDVMYHAQISKDLEPMLKDIKVSDAEVKKYYSNNPEYRTSHILFRLTRKPKKKEIEEKLTQALQVYRTLQKKPETFAELSAKFSETSVSQSAGDLGFQPAIGLAPEYFAAIKGKKPGYISPPIQTQFGYHIIKVMAVKGVKEINDSFYKKVIYDQKRDAILNNYFAQMKKGAAIKINKHYLK